MDAAAKTLESARRQIFLNEKQLARRWLLSPRTLQRWRSEGKGPPFLKIGGRCIYRLEDAEALELRQLRSSSGKR